MCLVSLPFLAINTDDYISNIMRGPCSVTTFGSSFISSLFSIMKCAKAIPEVHAALFSLASLDDSTGPVKCVQ